LQEVIDAFILVYKDDQRKCKERQSLLSATNSSAGGLEEERTTSFASSFLAARTNSSAASFAGGGSKRKLHGNDGNNAPSSSTEGKGEYDTPSTDATIHVNDLNVSGSRLQQRQLAVKWHPFHPDVQKSIHFW